MFENFCVKTDFYLISVYLAFGLGSSTLDSQGGMVRIESCDSYDKHKGGEGGGGP